MTHGRKRPYDYCNSEAEAHAQPVYKPPREPLHYGIGELKGEVDPAVCGLGPVELA